MQFVPWQRIADWKCNTCGDCCKLYSVVLGFPEWLRIIKTFGVETTVADIGHLYIKRAGDGSCQFLCRGFNTHYCGLQGMKPEACKLWPFKVMSEPKYGHPEQATFNHAGRRLFVYADSMCSGLRFGNPKWEFGSQTVREFVELALGTCRTQCKTTGKLSSPYWQPWRITFP